MRAYALGFIPESLQGDYQDYITRVELCALAVAFYETYTGEAITALQSFPDDEGDLNVRKMAGLGIVQGSGGLFRPEGTLDARGAAVIIVRLLKQAGIDLPEAAPAFADNADITITSSLLWAKCKPPGSWRAAAAGLTHGEFHKATGDYTAHAARVGLFD